MVTSVNGIVTPTANSAALPGMNESFNLHHSGVRSGIVIRGKCAVQTLKSRYQKLGNPREASIRQLRSASWWRIFHLLLILPLTLMLLSAVVGAVRDVPSTSCSLIAERLRLRNTNVVTWLWAGALSGFMFGGNWQDLLAIAASWLALWRENHRRVWRFVAIPAAVFVKRNASIFQPILQKVRFFDPSDFYHGFFSRFGPREFMGVRLHGAWWILIYYAVIMFVCNIGGDELWWRGYVLPRQELAFGRAAWVIHGLFWSAFHLFM